jgi:putative ABC transport system substrate-binding protein
MIKKVLLALIILMAIPQPLLAQATGRTPRIGLLGVSLDARLKESLLAGMREHGYANVAILDRGSLREYPELLPAAKELVGQNVDVIVAFGAQAPRVAFEATKTIPIVIIGADPVVAGMATSYSRPGGNVTGVSGRSLDLYPKIFELLKELLPKVKRVAAMLNPESPTEVVALGRVQAEAQRLKLDLHRIEVRRADDFESGFAAASKAKSEALVIIPSTIFAPHKEKIAALALKYRMPSISFDSDYIESGILVVYGPNRLHMYRRAAGYVARILKGQRPAEMPIDQATEFELHINAATASALGVKIPQTLRVRASINQ